jgi:hypothetical protein
MRDPRAARFIDWWERNEQHYYPAFWHQLFDSWMEPFYLDSGESYQLYLDAAEEYHEREWVRWHAPEPEGMVVTDFERIPDGDESSQLRPIPGGERENVRRVRDL